MKATVNKILKSLLTNLSFIKIKKYSQKKIILISLIAIIFLILFSYLLRPIYFDLNAKKNILESNIQKTFKLKTKIEGKISYKIFPSPRIVVRNIKLDFEDNKKPKIEKTQILLNPLKLKSFESFELEKFLVLRQTIKIYPSNLIKIFNFFTNKEKGKVVLKDTKIIFEDNQKNNINFTDLNLKENFSKNKHEIDANLKFSEKKINVTFINNFNGKKYLELNIPKLKQSLEINFDEKSTLKNLIGQLRLKVFESILLLNFEGKDNYKIDKSYLRNKFINSKIKGNIFLKDQFNFNIDLDINKIKLRKLLLYYPIFKTGGLSKKINGKLNISIKNSETLFGKINDAKMVLLFQNGDIKLKNALVNFSENSQVKLNLTALLSDKNPQIDFDTEFLSNDLNKFARKFGLYNFDDEKISIYADGYLDLTRSRLKLKKVVRDRSQLIGKSQITILEKSLNENVLNEGVLGILDFFKFKKFFQEVL